MTAGLRVEEIKIKIFVKITGYYVEAGGGETDSGTGYTAFFW